MAGTYKINDVAQQSGFSTATLRYYEEIGLLTTAARTAAGYRLYDDSVLDRLAFIARAKQLGCSLDETAGLLVAWDGGRCGPVQHRLRDLVTDKLGAARSQIAELTTLIGQLERATHDLDGSRPDDPCDDDCGCATLASQDAAATAVTFTSRAPHRTVRASGAAPIACSLDAPAQVSQLGAWRRVLAGSETTGDLTGTAGVATREPIDGGVRLTLAAGTDLAELVRLVASEQDCCRFLAFAVTFDARGAGLEVTAPDGAAVVLDALFGAAAGMPA